GRGAVVPALAYVRALRFLAHGVEVQLPHQALEARIPRRARGAHLQPLRLRRARRRRCCRTRRERSEGDDAGHSHYYMVRSRCWPIAMPATLLPMSCARGLVFSVAVALVLQSDV